MTLALVQEPDVLTAAEREQLAEQEAIIEHGLATFIEVGRALKAIRYRRLYRADYDTFEDYCQQKWGMVASRARQLIAAAQVTENVRTVTAVTPANEAQVRPLAGLEKVEQREAWQRATKLAQAEGGPVRARHVEQAVAEQKAGCFDHDRSAVVEAVRVVVERGLLDQRDLDGLPAAAVATLASELRRADEDFGIEHRDQRQAMNDTVVLERDGKWHVSRSLIRKWGQEAAAKLRAGKVRPAAVRHLVRADARFDGEQAISHAEAREAFERSLRIQIERLKSGEWSNVDALRKIIQQNESIGKTLAEFAILAWKWEGALTVNDVYRQRNAATARPPGPADGSGETEQ
jgi:hypothetical protein